MNSECLRQNCFEQICINFVNEKIRKFSTNRLIKEEVDWYESEGLSLPQIGFLDNQNIISKYIHLFCSMYCMNNIHYFDSFSDLLEDKTDGIFSLLDDESKKRAPSSMNFMRMVCNTCIKNPFFALPRSKSSVESQCFVIRHFCQDVSYSSVNRNNSID